MLDAKPRPPVPQSPAPQSPVPQGRRRKPLIPITELRTDKSDKAGTYLHGSLTVEKSISDPDRGIRFALPGGSRFYIFKRRRKDTDQEGKRYPSNHLWIAASGTENLQYLTGLWRKEDRNGETFLTGSSNRDTEISVSFGNVQEIRRIPPHTRFFVFRPRNAGESYALSMALPDDDPAADLNPREDREEIF